MTYFPATCNFGLLFFNMLLFNLLLFSRNLHSCAVRSEACYKIRKGRYGGAEMNLPIIFRFFFRIRPIGNRFVFINIAEGYDAF
jgi:hypothetical protein